jgi:hypothetical protein
VVSSAAPRVGDVTKEYMSDTRGRNPYLIGLLIGVILAGALIASVVWAPGFWNPASEWWHELLFFSTCVFAILLSRYWRFRTRGRLWASIALFVVGNAVLVVIFIDRVRHFVAGNYALIIFCEVFVSFLFLDWILDSRKSNR